MSTEGRGKTLFLRLTRPHGQADWRTGEERALLLFGGDLCSFPGDGVLHGLQLFQQLLTAGQRVAGFVGARAGARAGGRGGARHGQLAQWRCWAFPR